MNFWWEILAGVAIWKNTTQTHLPNTQLWRTDFSLSVPPCVIHIWSNQSEGWSCEGSCMSFYIYKYPHLVSTLFSLALAHWYATTVHRGNLSTIKMTKVKDQYIEDIHYLLHGGSCRDTEMTLPSENNRSVARNTNSWRSSPENWEQPWLTGLHPTAIHWPKDVLMLQPTQQRSPNAHSRRLPDTETQMPQQEAQPERAHLDPDTWHSKPNSRSCLCPRCLDTNIPSVWVNSLGSFQRGSTPRCLPSSAGG